MCQAAFARRGALGQAIPGASPTHRAHHFLWNPGGRCTWRIFNLYGEADGHGPSHERTGGMVRAALCEAEARRRCPALIVGDMNAQYGELGPGWISTATPRSKRRCTS